MKQKIIWLIDSLGFGGAERLTGAILQQIKSDQFEFRVCTLQEKQGNPAASALRQVGIPIDQLSIPNLRHPANLPKLLWYISKHTPVLIHTQLEFSNILGSIAGHLLGIPVVNTLHAHVNPESGSAYWRNWLSTFCFNHLSNRVIAVSDETRTFHIQKNHIQDRQIITIYNGLNLAQFQNLPQGEIEFTKHSLNLPSDAIVFTTVAVLREPKGIQYMLEAIPSILEQVPNFQYLIVGDGNHASDLKQLAESLGINKHVIFTGHRTDVLQLLAISDVFVLPSLTEALPTVLIEAMASRKPIVATKVGGIPEMVSNRINGLLVNPADAPELAIACVELARDKDLRASMAQEGFRLACERFDIKKQIKLLIDLYSSLIRQNGIS